MNIDYSKLKKLNAAELRKGMTVVGDPSVTSCWTINGLIVPVKILKIKDNSNIINNSDNGICTCSDRNKLYLYKDNLTNNNLTNTIMNLKEKFVLALTK